MRKEVIQYLKENKITFKEHFHSPVFTVEQARKQYTNIKGTHCKNLFLKDSVKQKYYLIVLNFDNNTSISELRKTLNAKKLSFAKPEELKQKLKLTPGSVSPFGLINDKTHEIILVINQKVWDSKTVSFHPNINTSTLELEKQEFHKIIKNFQNQLILIPV